MSHTAAERTRPPSHRTAIVPNRDGDTWEIAIDDQAATDFTLDYVKIQEPAGQHGVPEEDIIMRYCELREDELRHESHGDQIRLG